MLMTVAELRQYIDTDETDALLEAKLAALELLIRAYTNNNFQARNYRGKAVADGGMLVTASTLPFSVGDTLQITDSFFSDGELVTILDIVDNRWELDKPIPDEEGITVTKVVYPADVKMGVVNLIKWELTSRDKVGVASESISRHSVTYFSMDGDNSTMGFPKSLMGFLAPYRKARFGQGMRV